jgi:hypothetical protein
MSNWFAIAVARGSLASEAFEVSSPYKRSFVPNLSDGIRTSEFMLVACNEAQAPAYGSRQYPQPRPHSKVFVNGGINLFYTLCSISWLLGHMAASFGHKLVVFVVE